MNMVGNINNLKDFAKVQDVKFGSNIVPSAYLGNKPDEVELSSKNTGKKLLLGATAIVALIGFRNKIAGFVQKYFPNFAKNVGEKFTAIKNAVINFFKTHTPNKEKMVDLVANTKENITKTYQQVAEKVKTQI